jgi:ACR3 family arsenite transporter
MSEAVAVVPGKAPSIATFERYLTLWSCFASWPESVSAIPCLDFFHILGTATVAQINLPIAVLVWLMIIPVLLKIDLGALGQVKEHWHGIAATIGVNSLVKPFSMALLGWLFIDHLFRAWLPAAQIDAYVAGLILLAAVLLTLVLLFGLQGVQIMREPLLIALLAVPILRQVYGNAGLAY